MRLLKGLVTVAALIGWAGTAAASDGKAKKPPKPQKSDTLVLANYVLSFEENFDKLDVSAWGCNSRWIAHTPWGGDFGAAPFANPTAKFPFQIKNGILDVIARLGTDKRWRSGMLSSWDACNSGFVQKYGYFEIRARTTPVGGLWPAFWLVGVDKSRGTAEIDIFEHHTDRPSQYTAAYIKHPSKTNTRRVVRSTRVKVESGIMARQFNTYGADINEKRIAFYFNRRKVWEIETPDEFKQPMMILTSFAMEERPKAEHKEARFSIDYIRAYQRRPWPSR